MNGTFLAFGIAIGYASNFVPAENLWGLAIGLTGCAFAYLVLAFYQRNLRKHFRAYSFQTLLLVLAAIAPLTSKMWSAIWAIVFVSLGCIGVLLDFAFNYITKLKDR
jgi:uncharacterized membrane protein